METNREIYSRDTGDYSDLALARPEQQLLSLFGTRWSQIEMLDVGIGAGRTSYTFAPLAGRYVGIDYSPQMVDLARGLLGETDDRVELLVADARDLSGLRGPFDFVLFSFNGLDSVGHEDRLKILAELRKASKPDGHFLFSSHSMRALPLATRKARNPDASLPRAAYSWMRQLSRARRVQAENRKLDLPAARKRGWAIVRDGAHNFDVEYYYVEPAFQEAQLEDAGFRLIAARDHTGNPVDIQSPGRDPWLHYHCRPI
jgi:SAM-dependent methyltransferase